MEKKLIGENVDLLESTVGYHEKLRDAYLEQGNLEDYAKSTGFIDLARGITLEKLRTKNAKLEEMAYEDTLTGLGNRRYFDKTLEREASLARRNRRDLSLVFFDIDHFKPFNDNYGHDAGDFVLSKLGRIVSKNVRASDIVSRYGGEEFAVILPDTDKKGGYAAAEKIRKAVESERWEYAGEDLGKVSVSLGVSGYRYTDVESFIKRADEAAYVAKESGRDRTVVSED